MTSAPIALAYHRKSVNPKERKISSDGLSLTAIAELRAWRSLSWLERRRTDKPKPP